MEAMLKPLTATLLRAGRPAAFQEDSKHS